MVYVPFYRTYFSVRIMRKFETSISPRNETPNFIGSSATPTQVVDSYKWDDYCGENSHFFAPHLRPTCQSPQARSSRSTTPVPPWRRFTRNGRQRNWMKNMIRSPHIWNHSDDGSSQCRISSAPLVRCWLQLGPIGCLQSLYLWWFCRIISAIT